MVPPRVVAGRTRTRGARRGMAKRRGAGRRARRTTIGALRRRLRVRAGHNLPVLVTVAAPAPLRFAGAATRTALTSYGPRVSEVAAPARSVGARRPVTRAHDALRSTADEAQGECVRVLVAVLRTLGAQIATLRAAVEHAVDAHPDGHIVAVPQGPITLDAEGDADRQRGACRGASEAEGAGVATVTTMAGCGLHVPVSARARRRRWFGGRGARHPSASPCRGAYRVSALSPDRHARPGTGQGGAATDAMPRDRKTGRLRTGLRVVGGRR